MCTFINSNNASTQCEICHTHKSAKNDHDYAKELQAQFDHLEGPAASPDGGGANSDNNNHNHNRNDEYYGDLPPRQQNRNVNSISSE